MRSIFVWEKSPLGSIWTTSFLGLCALTAGAASYTEDFTTDPTPDPDFIVRFFGGGGFWHDGYLTITDNYHANQRTTIVLPDFNNANPVSAFRFTARVRIGGGTARPGEGVSISFGDDAGGYVNEEGVATGLTVSFDTRDNRNGEAPAIEMKWNNGVFARKRFAGDALTAGPGYLPEERDATGAPVRIQTDPPGSTGLGTPTWTDLSFSVSAAGAASLRYKGLDIFKDVVVPGWAPRAGRFIIGARTSSAIQAHWIDDIGITTETNDAPPRFISSSPGGNPAAHQNEFVPVSFMINEAISVEDVDRNSIRLAVGGQDVTTAPGTRIQFDTPVAGQITVTHVPGGLGYPPASRVEAVLTYRTMEDVPFTARKELLITEVPANTALGPPLFIEAEDFNYSEDVFNGEIVHGQFFDFGAPAGSYNGKAAQHDVDYHLGDGGNADSPLYRSLNPPNGISGHPDNIRAGGILVSPDYKIGWNDPYDSYNYTRTFPNNTYKIYGRFSSGETNVLNSHGRSTLSRVVSNPGASNQTIVDIGFFDFRSTGGWDTFIGFQPLRDATGKELIVRLNGLTTLRHTTRPGEYDVNYFAFVPTFNPDAVSPFAVLSPAETRMRDDFTIMATIVDGVTRVVPGSVRLFLDDVELTGVTITPTADGAEAQIRITSSPAFGPHTVRVIFSDNSAPVPIWRTNTTALIVSPYKTGLGNNLFIEAEDFNFSDDGITGGLHANFGDPDCPTQGKSAIVGIDYEDDPGHPTPLDGFPANGGYRPPTGVDVAKPGDDGGDGFIRGDQTITCTYIVGWTDTGNWYNYTRDFGPGARYNVFLRAASGDVAQPERAELALITSDATRLSQTKEVIGEFNSPPSGAWDIFHTVPLRDSSGRLVNIRLEGLKTLRLTRLPGTVDFNFISFVKADDQVIEASLASVEPRPDSAYARQPNITVVLRNEDTRIVGAATRLIYDGVDVSASTVTTPTADGVQASYQVPNPSPVGTLHTVHVEWTDDGTPPLTQNFTWQYREGTYNAEADFFIEMEDFNFDSGDFHPSKPGLPFNLKNQYYGWGAVHNIDYHESGAGDCNAGSCVYRPPLVVTPAVSMIGIDDSYTNGAGPRPGFEVVTDYKIGWTDPAAGGDWYNYTRDFGAGREYNVYLRASHGQVGATIGGRLEFVDDPASATPTLRPLGNFRAPATGDWNRFTFIPLTNEDGEVVRVPLAGRKTLRYTVEAIGGDLNYLMFTPLLPALGPRLTIARSANNVTITWPSGILQSAPAITGPWGNETGATSPLELNSTAGMRFYRTITP
jgi:hypothetical protein